MKKVINNMSQVSLQPQGQQAPGPASAYVEHARSPTVREAARQAVLARTEEMVREAGRAPNRVPQSDGLPMHLAQGSKAFAQRTGLSNESLRRFLERVQAEPEIRMLLAQTRLSANRVPRTASAALQQAAAQVSFWCVLPRAQREVLYVATLVAGIGRLLAPTVKGKTSVDNVLFTMVCTALHRLDEETPSEASLLRQCLGWGNSDEIDEQIIPGVRRAIGCALDHALDGKTVSIGAN